MVRPTWRTTTLSRLRLFLVSAAAVLLAACAGAGSAATTPEPSPSPTAEPVNTPAVVTAPPGTPRASIAIGPGEPWVLYGRHLNDRERALFLVRPDGSGDHRILTQLDPAVAAFDWSPDGQQIAFVYRGAGSAPDGEIWTANADGTGAAKRFDGAPECSGAYHPGWSPDGTRIAFVCYTADGNGRLSTWDLATGTRRDLYRYAWPEHLDNGPRWSPDGSTIAFDILHWDPTNTFLDGSVIATVPAAGGEVTRLTRPGQFFAHPSWRPDGKALVVNDYDLGNMPRAAHASNLFELGLDGTVLRQITTGSVDGSLRIAQPSWDPSGDRIWVTVFTPDEAPWLHPGWVDPATGDWTILPVAGGVPEMRPVLRTP
jgi:Tol biopolymer transport system component